MFKEEVSFRDGKEIDSTGNDSRHPSYTKLTIRMLTPSKIRFLISTLYGVGRLERKSINRDMELFVFVFVETYLRSTSVLSYVTLF